MAPRDVRPDKEFIDVPGQPQTRLYTHVAATSGSQRLIFTSGCWGMRDGKFSPSLKQQVDDTFSNLNNALLAGGATPQDIVKLTFYVVGWPWTETEALTEPWIKLLTRDGNEGQHVHRPPVTLVAVPNLAHPDAKFEIDAVASVAGLSRPIDYRAPQPAQTPPTEVDVVVIGAGFSGTQAAHDLNKAGLSVRLLEATHRVGGRSKTVKLASGPGCVELGATWINQTTQPKIYETVKRLGLHTVPQHLEGDGVLQTLDGKVYRFGSQDKVGSSPWVSPSTMRCKNIEIWIQN